MASRRRTVEKRASRAPKPAPRKPYYHPEERSRGDCNENSDSKFTQEQADRLVALSAGRTVVPGGGASDPCPFCSGEARLEKELRPGYPARMNDPDAYSYTYVCRACACRGPWQKSATSALRWWNIRQPEPIKPATAPAPVAPTSLCTCGHGWGSHNEFGCYVKVGYPSCDDAYCACSAKPPKAGM